MPVKIIMIIDDDADDRAIFCESLQEVDPTVACIACSSGMEALELLKNSHQALPDFIFLDLNMPRMNGKQFLQELKKNEKLNEVPVIIYSTSKTDADEKSTRQQGAVHFITKPCSMREMRQTIKEIITN